VHGASLIWDMLAARRRNRQSARMNPDPLPAGQPPADCARCPRLAAYRDIQRVEHPDWFNAPVPALGDPDAWLAIIGLAPGLHGANRTGRAFTGDGSGKILFDTLARFGFATGDYTGTPTEDTLVLKGAVIINAVRCAPPQNKPTPEEMRNCRDFLADALGALPRLRAVVALGQVAHQSGVKALGGKLPKYRFVHGAEHRLPTGVVVLDSYHCSRYNQNIGRITHNMLDSIFERAAQFAP